MIKDINIQNFRCFQDTKISGFGKVNLITGKNNAGKTAFLEALLLSNSPRPEQINFLRRTRRESSSFSKTLPERTWDTFFYNQDKSKKIAIQITYDQNDSIHSSTISISIDDKSNKSIESYLDDSNSDSYQYSDLFSNTKPEVSPLKLELSINGEQCFEASLIATVEGFLGKSPKIPNLKKVTFIPATILLSNEDLALEYDKAIFNNKEKTKEVLHGFQVIDPLINLVETFSVGKPMLYLTRENAERLPISLFGDAINRVANIILSIINSNSSLLLIDEIENGIHYTNQVGLCRMLFRLAKELDVQIFATTHSLEMLRAFTEVGLESEEFKSMGVHFEMARNIRNSQIIGIKRDLETLDYSLDHNKGVRGE